METIDKNEFDRLTKRVEILEQKIQYLGRLLAQIGENIAADGPSEAPKSGKVCNEALPAETKAPLSAEPFRAVAPAIEHREEREINLTPAGSEPKMEETMTLQDDNSLAAGLDEFKQKYDSGSVDFHLNLDIARDLVKDLKRYPEWNQVPDSVKASLYLEEAGSKRQRVKYQKKESPFPATFNSINGAGSRPCGSSSSQGEVDASCLLPDRRSAKVYCVNFLEKSS